MSVFEQPRTSDEKFWLMLDKGKVRWADTEKTDIDPFDLLFKQSLAVV